MCADFAIHDNGDGNPHAHVMVTKNNVSKEGIGSRNGDWDKREALLEWREDWARICNVKFKEKGLDERIDHRTLKEQGIDREIQQKIEKSTPKTKDELETKIKEIQSRAVILEHDDYEHER